MEKILSPLSVSISDLRKQPAVLIEQADGEAIAILNHNRPTAYIVSPEVYESYLDMLEDIELGKLIEQRKGEKRKAVFVKVDDL